MWWVWFYCNGFQWGFHNFHVNFNRKSCWAGNFLQQKLLIFATKMHYPYEEAASFSSTPFMASLTPTDASLKAQSNEHSLYISGNRLCRRNLWQDGVWLKQLWDQWNLWRNGVCEGGEWGIRVWYRRSWRQLCSGLSEWHSFRIFLEYKKNLY